MWRERRPRLPRLEMELTERCNFDCVHCAINRPATDACAARELRLTEIRDILQQAAALGALTVRFTGGEPLLREDFAEVYLAARRLGLRVALITNAALVTPELADLLARVPPLGKVEVSVYGMTPETAAAVTRRSGAYEATQRGLKLLRERRVPFVVRTVVLPQNRHELGEFEAWSGTLPGGQAPPFVVLLLSLRSRRDSVAKNCRIVALRTDPAEVVRLLNRRGLAYREETRQFCRRFLGVLGDKIFSCGAGEVGCVDAYGGFQMCLGLRHPDTVYELRAGSLADALERFFPRWRAARSQQPEFLRRCARCFLRGLCEQCPAHAWAEHGTLDTPVEYFCAVAHAQAVDLDLLQPGEQAWEVADWRERLEHLERTP